MDAKDKAIRQLAVKYQFTNEQIEKIIDYPFMKLRDIVEQSSRADGEFKNVRISFFGLFKVSKRKRKILMELERKRMENPKPNYKKLLTEDLSGYPPIQKQMAILRAKICVSCSNLSRKDLKCIKCDCAFPNILLKPEKKCPVNKW